MRLTIPPAGARSRVPWTNGLTRGQGDIRPPRGSPPVALLVRGRTTPSCLGLLEHRESHQRTSRVRDPEFSPFRPEEIGAHRGDPRNDHFAARSQLADERRWDEVGTTLSLPLPDGRRGSVFVRGVWRDYARQSGAIVIERAEWLRLSGDPRIRQFAAF